MKLSDVRPCDECGGPIAPMFYVVRISSAMFNVNTTNAVLGLRQLLGGALELAEMMGPSNEVITVFGDKEPELMTELFICHSCTLGLENGAPFAGLMTLMEKVNERTG